MVNIVVSLDVYSMKVPSLMALAYYSLLYSPKRLVYSTFLTIRLLIKKVNFFPSSMDRGPKLISSCIHNAKKIAENVASKAAAEDFISLGQCCSEL